MSRLTKLQKFEQQNLEVIGEFNNFRNSVENIAELPSLILNNQSLFWKGAALSDSHNIWELVNIKQRKGMILPTPKLINISKFDYKWRDKIADYHSRPIGATRANTTKFYPGWEGSINWTVEWPHEFSSYYLGSKLFYHSNCGIYQSSGGGGQSTDDTQTFHYGFVIFAADFPKLYEKAMRSKYLIDENRNRKLMWQSIGGTSNPTEITEIPNNWVMPDPLQGVE